MTALNMDEHSSEGEDEQERKKRLKREANRRSAQLSRQRKKAFVEDLKAKNAEFLHAKNVLACHPDAVFATDGRGVIAYANPAAATRANADAKRLEGTSLPNLLDADSRRRLETALRDADGERPGASVSLGGPLQLARNGSLEVTVECSAAPGAPGERLAVAAGRPARKRARSVESRGAEPRADGVSPLSAN